MNKERQEVKTELNKINMQLSLLENLKEAKKSQQ